MPPPLYSRELAALSCARRGLGTTWVVADCQQEKSNQSAPLRVSKTIFSQLCIATHANYWYSMLEVTGSREGVSVAVEAAADPRQVALHLGLFSLWSGEGEDARNCMDSGVVPHISTLH